MQQEYNCHLVPWALALGAIGTLPVNGTNAHECGRGGAYTMCAARDLAGT
jgi:hypothetical protein